MGTTARTSLHRITILMMMMTIWWSKATRLLEFNRSWERRRAHHSTRNVRAVVPEKRDTFCVTGGRTDRGIGYSSSWILQFVKFCILHSFALCLFLHCVAQLFIVFRLILHIFGWLDGYSLSDNNIRGKVGSEYCFCVNWVDQLLTRFATPSWHLGQK